MTIIPSATIIADANPPSAADFRAAGFTANAIHYPLSELAIAWVCHFNGAAPGWIPPRAWRYAPNPAMRFKVEALAAAWGKRLQEDRDDVWRETLDMINNRVC